MKFKFLLLFAAIGLVLPSAFADQGTAVQDEAVLGFAKRVLPWYPNSVFTIAKDEVFHTSVGDYRIVTVDRSCTNQYLSNKTTLVLDEVTDLVWIGSLGMLPEEGGLLDSQGIKNVVEGFLPGAIYENLKQRVRIEWGTSEQDFGALMGFDLLVDSGYGEYRKPAAVTADGRMVMMGYAIPFDQDPVAYRRDLLAESEVVIWDHPGKDAKVTIIEVSDLECPGCKRKWPLIEEELGKYGSQLRHGMVSYPLTSIHPWSFRAACATWCLSEQDPQQVLPFKKLFYSLQREMSVSQVTPTSVDFLLGVGLEEEAFRSCYLREPSLTAVHEQLELAHQLGVNATPTYFVDGWLVQMPEESWFNPLLARLIEGKEPILP